MSERNEIMMEETGMSMATPKIIRAHLIWFHGIDDSFQAVL